MIWYDSESDDCLFLDDPRNNSKNRNDRGGTWYCCARITYLPQKCPYKDKKKCKFYYPVSQQGINKTL